jgi:hypothetical protein
VERKLLFETDAYEHFIVLILESFMASQKFFVRFIETVDFMLATRIALVELTSMQQRRVRVVGHEKHQRRSRRGFDGPLP